MASREPTFVALALGANLGDAETTFRQALAHLEAQLGPLQVAPLYLGPAQAPTPQPDYLNTVATGHSRLPADGILALAQWLERAAGRQRGERWAPRPLDIDLLLYGDLVSERPELTLPHPGLRGRRFVLVPLADLHPQLTLPPGGETVADLLRGAPPAPGLSKIRESREWY